MIHTQIIKYYKHLGYNILDFQRDVIQQFQQHHHGLIQAPTGRGKTLALFLAILNHNLIQKKVEKLIWITPMRALVTDTLMQIENAIKFISPDIKLMQRTSDTSSYQKAKLRKSDWDILITTPESCSVLGTHEEMVAQFKQVRLIVIDEWHCLYGEKRGILLELFLSWLKQLNPNHRRWALSATISNAKLACNYLVPYADVKLIKDDFIKQIHTSVMLPQNKSQNMLGNLGSALINQVVEEIKSVRSTILFTNTRSQSENWFQLLKDSHAFSSDEIGIHHSAIDATLRKEAESGIRAGEIRCLVATSSLDLGVDLKPVDKVLHLGSPKGFSRLKQRAGRSGHSPFSKSEIIIIPRHTFELIEGFATALFINDPLKEEDPEHYLPYDILMQHLISIGLIGSFTIHDIQTICHDTVTFSNITDQEIEWLVYFCCNKHSILKAYPEYCKLIEEKGLFSTNDQPLIKKAHRLSIGTITSEESMTVILKNRKKLGRIEEGFIRQLQIGDTFLFSGKILSIEKIQDKQVIVKVAKSKIPKFTRWLGGYMSNSTQLSDSILAIFELYKTAKSKLNHNLCHVLDWQASRSYVPFSHECLIEIVTIEKLTTVFIYSLCGRKANHALGLSLTYSLSSQFKSLVGSTVNDYGVMLQFEKNIDVDKINWQSLLTVDSIQKDCEKGFNANEMVLQEFRHICMISGLINKGMPGKNKSPQFIQSNTKILYDIFKEFDPKNLFLKQAQAMIYQTHIFPDRLKERLGKINKNIVIKKIDKCSPFGFSLYTEQLISKIGSSL